MNTDFAINNPLGAEIRIPTNALRDIIGDPDPTNATAVRAHFDAEGYVILRGIVPSAQCRRVQDAYEREVKPSRGYFLRHESGKAERHVFTEHGHMKYPIMNLQDLPRQRYGAFQRSGLEVLTHPSIQRTLRGFFGEPGRLVHTMFFDGNQVTWAHQDTYYIDSTRIGSMVGVWVALEDIQPGAGRFFVCPRSHLLPLRKLGKGDDFDPNGPEYKASVLRMIADNGLDCRAPALRQGDVLLFSSRTIHGSLETRQPQFSRRCVTGHYVPMSGGVVWGHRERPLGKASEINGVPVLHHNDLSIFWRRVVFEAVSRSPLAGKIVRATARMIRERAAARATKQLGPGPSKS